jgi:hypothetical protein
MTEAVVRLEPQELMEAATDATGGLTDFGDGTFVEPLTVAARSLDRQARLSATGRLITRQQLIDYLSQRLLLEEWVRRYPEIETEEISAPVIIVGLPRTGTTLLYRMLSVADELTAPLHYEAASVAPPLDWNFEVAGDPRVAAAETSIEAMNAAAPELLSIYPFEAMAPEEDIFISGASFRTTSIQSSARVPEFEAWLAEADRVPLYRFLRRSLQMLQWQRRRRRPPLSPARWLLKTPDHIHGLDALLDVFPEAKVVQTHRDPVQTIPSICSFIRALHSIGTDEVDVAGIGDAWSAMFARSMTRALRTRQANPSQFCDVWYDDTVRAPRRVAEEVFSFIGQPLDDAAWNEMERWREANQREARPSHHYTLEEFGLSEERIAKEFSEYRESFILGERR